MANILWEGIFLDPGTIQRLEQAAREEGELPFANRPQYPHVTTAFGVNAPHMELYGERVLLCIGGFVRDEAIQTPNRGVVKAEGFHIMSMEAEDERLQDILNQEEKFYHITVSYSGKAVDTNYVDLAKERATPGLRVWGTYGGYDIEKNQPVFSFGS
ncbi:MAG TPA: hypothetical protein IAB48_00680 [Candidatus Fimimorpha excrementavium]|nr:hypothetical protein [Candidatus Fimimorpha excrementavium]